MGCIPMTRTATSAPSERAYRAVTNPSPPLFPLPQTMTTRASSQDIFFHKLHHGSAGVSISTDSGSPYSVMAR